MEKEKSPIEEPFIDLSGEKEEEGEQKKKKRQSILDETWLPDFSEETK